MKKLFASAITLALLLGCLSGCGGTAPSAETPADTAVEASAPPAGGQDEPEAVAVNGSAAAADDEAPDYDLAFSRYAPDTPVLTVGTVTYDWSMFFDLLRQNINMLYAYGIRDLTTDTGDGRSIGDLMLESTVSRLKQFGLIYSKAEERGLALDAEDEAEIDEDFKFRMSYYNDDKELMLSSMGVSEEYFRYAAGEEILYDKLLADQFGPDGSALSDEDEDNGILYAQHILFMTVDPATMEKLDDDAVAKARESAENTLAELKAASPEELPELFATLMQQRSEDTGLYSNPDGYFFREGEMVDSFYQAALALEEGELSEIVESEYGYHILFHPVLTPDVIYGLENGEHYTLRTYVASSLFNNMVNDWFNELQVSFYDDFEALDVAALFEK